MEQKKVQGFLQKTYKIIVDYQQEKLKQLHCGENTGNQFNIFEIIGISTREVYMCRILAELLNPNGCHCQRTKYLDLFCNRFLPDRIKKEIKTENVSVITEDLTKNLDDIGKEYRRIDIVIDEKDGHYIPIEVKINALEQQEQCSDYLYSTRKIYEERHKNKNDAVIFYLTKTGEMPISISSEDEDSVMCISWIQLVDWLNECICQIDTIRKIPITEIIMQYKTAIEKIAENIGEAKRSKWIELKEKIRDRITSQKSYDENKLYDDSDKIAYAKSEPVDNNIVQYHVIVYESGKIQKAEIWYTKNDNEIRYNRETKNSRKIIEFVDIIEDEKLNEKAKECVSFLFD